MDWQLDTYFSGVQTEEYKAFRKQLTDRMSALESQLNPESEFSVDALSNHVLELEQIDEDLSHLFSYVGCLVSAEADSEVYISEEASLAEIESNSSKLFDSMSQILGNLSASEFAMLEADEGVSARSYYLRKLRDEAKRKMAPELEGLAADLGINGIGAWSRMYFNSVGVLKINYTDGEGVRQTIPFSQYRSLISQPDRRLRKAVFAGAKEQFKEHRIAFAGALNAISGTRLELNKRRGIGDFLTPTLKQSRMSHGTLEALMTAVDEMLPKAREIFKKRCLKMGSERGGYYDLNAPSEPDAVEGPEWVEACKTVSQAFHAAYPGLGQFFDEVVEKKWIDYNPRDSKRPGGFCTTSQKIGESRIFMTYRKTMNDIMTLAHEAGHAWHSRLLVNEPTFNTGYPMTLAETASTFAEKILADGVLSSASFSDEQKAAVADVEEGNVLAFLLDLPVRFKFEKAFYDQRAKGVLSPQALCDLMVETQKSVFDDTLEPEGFDEWFWVSKLHFYIDGTEFYNYPYTFGYLMSQALYKRFKDQGEAFIPVYERFMEMSGKADCETVVRECLGEDITNPAFWKIL